MNTLSNPPSPTDLPHDIYGSNAAMKPTMRDRYETAKERCGELYEGAREKVSAGARTTDLAIRNNPYSALGLALGVGVLVGMLIGRSTSRHTNENY